jgi:hypothetical protein
MSRMKALLLGLMAVMALSSVVSATASAELNGPWWKQEEGGAQFKLPQNKERQVKSINQTPFELRSNILGIKIIIKCNSVLDTGTIWNGLHQGEDETEAKFTQCSFAEPAKCNEANTKIEVLPVRAYTELMWKYAGQKGNEKELHEIGQQKIFDVFAPTEAPTAGKAIYTKIEIENAGAACKGKFPVSATGTEQKFIDQNQVEHNIVWGTAAEVTPQNADLQVGTLKWTYPNVKTLHHQEKEVTAKLEFGAQPAELQGIIKVQENSMVPFGAWNE